MANRDAHRVTPEPGESPRDTVRRAMEEAQQRLDSPPVVGNEPEHPGCSCTGRCQHGG